jgi:hypothetical protein
MLKTAVILLALTALGGLTMAYIRFSGTERPPAWLAMAHGLLAGSALTLLLYAAFTTGLSTMALLGTVVLVAAAAGGAFLNLAYHAQLKALPKNIIVAHAVLAVVGFGLLAVAAFR